MSLSSNSFICLSISSLGIGGCGRYCLVWMGMSSMVGMLCVTALAKSLTKKVAFAKRVSGEVEEVVVRINQVGPVSLSSSFRCSAGIVFFNC